MPAPRICLVRHGHRPLCHRLGRARDLWRAVAGGEPGRHPSSHGAALFRAASRARRPLPCSAPPIAWSRCCGARPPISLRLRSTWRECPRFSAVCTSSRAASRAVRPCLTVRSLRASVRRARPARVGTALRKNPFAIVVPCHRVLAAGGKPGGFNRQRRSRNQVAYAEDRAEAARPVRRGRPVRLRSRTGRGRAQRGRPEATALDRSRRGRAACN